MQHSPHIQDHALAGHAFKQCAGPCKSMKPPEGGLETGPGRWRCAACAAPLLRRLR